MKFAVSILLSTLLFFNSSLFTIIYSVKVIELSFISSFKIRLIEENIENENFNYEGVQLIKLPAKNPGHPNIKWIKENEFTLNGRYCDVISRRLQNDTVYIFYINDHEEDELNNTAIAHYQNEDGKQPEMKYFNILFSFLSNAIGSSYTDLYAPSFSTTYINYPLPDLNNISSDIPSPPPRNIS